MVMGNNHPESLFKFPTNGKGSLSKFSTQGTDGIDDKDQAVGKLEENIKTLVEQQDLLYASNRNSVLIIFQAMDAAGKDGTIKHVMSGLNPQSCQVYSFKQPSKEELDHDFLWRNYKCMPERGRIGIFNRSYYEEVLVVRVHPNILLNQQLPGIQDLKDIPHDMWKNRYRSINNLEKHLVDNGTIVIKFFLHLSKGEQKKRLLERIDDKSKRWKFSLADLKGILAYFAAEMMGPGVKVRFRPHFFPFTEPSVECDFSCHVCAGKGCKVCKNSGWIEIAGAGMVDPRVFKKVGIDADSFTGYAFGMGIERIAMIKFGIPDIRMIYENDIRFLEQFV